MKHLKLFSTLFALAFIVFFSSCSKEDCPTDTLDGVYIKSKPANIPPNSYDTILVTTDPTQIHISNFSYYNSSITIDKFSGESDEYGNPFAYRIFTLDKKCDKIIIKSKETAFLSFSECDKTTYFKLE